MRKTYAQQASIMAAAVRRFFLPARACRAPAGGYVLWVELPEEVDAMGALSRGIGTAHHRGTGAHILAGAHLSPPLHPPQLQRRVVGEMEAAVNTRWASLLWRPCSNKWL